MMKEAAQVQTDHLDDSEVLRGPPRANERVKQQGSFGVGLWLVSPQFDLLIFMLPAALALTLAVAEPVLSPSGELPFPAWILAVLLVDVAHVWTTLFPVYLSAEGGLRYRGVRIWAPLAGLGGLWVLASLSVAWFWTSLAYVAVFHFVRQQVGWVALYQRREPKLSRSDRNLERAFVYAATLVPVAWWHMNLPRDFVWFVSGDFIPIGGWLTHSLGEIADWDAALWGLYGFLGLLVLFRALQRWHQGAGPLALGKWTVMVTTAACWGYGIVLTESDWAFTWTNVLIHGVPYAAMVYRRSRSALPWLGPGLFVGMAGGLAALEELGWNLVVERPSFGPWTPMLLALLALPQFTHYVLDAYIWRRSPTVKGSVAIGT